NSDLGLEAAHIRWFSSAVRTRRTTDWPVAASTITLSIVAPLRSPTRLRIFVSARLHGGGKLEELFVKLPDCPLPAPTMKTVLPNREFLAWHRAGVFRGVPRS